MPVSTAPIIWPPDYVLEWQRRARIRNDALDDITYRIDLIGYYKTHPAEWIEDWCVTFDPRRKGAKLMPFLLFPRQREFVQFLYECWLDKENGLVEKCRDMGATWLCCAFALWLFLFHPGSVIGFGSRTREYVDKMGDPKAIFPKMRQILDCLPAWMMPLNWNRKEHDNFMRIVNPNTDAAVTGESGDNMGRGGRTTMYFKDESAHYEHPELVEAALGDNTDVQIDISSVNGSANVFYRKRMAGTVWFIGCKIPTGITRVFVFDYAEHPLKTQEWFNRREEAARREGLLHVFRQEVCRDYYGSADRQIIPQEWIQASVDAHIKLGLSDEGEKVAGQDIADGGADKNARVIRYGIVARECDEWGGEADEAAAQTIPVCAKFGVRELYYDEIGVGTAFRARAKTMQEKRLVPVGMKIIGWNAGGSVLEPKKHIIPDDKYSALNEDQYATLKSQAWFRLRARFYKTYRAVKFGEKFQPDEMISLDSTMPKLRDLMAQLSQAIWKSNASGQTLVDKKPEGALSPNLADACVICYCPVKPPAGFFSN